MRSTKRNEFFRRFLRAYIAVLAVPMVFGTIVYHTAFTAVEEQAIDTHRAILRQTQSALERSLREVERLALEIANDPKIRRFAFLDEPYRGANAYAILDTASTLTDRAFNNEMILGYYVFFKENEMVLGPDFASRMRRFYPELFQYSGIPYTRWVREFVTAPHIGTYVPAHEARVRDQNATIITYLRSFPVAGRPHGVVAILLDNAEFSNLFEGIDLDIGGWAAVMDGSGRVITQTSGGTEPTPALPVTITNAPDRSRIEQVNGRAMLITTLRSTTSDWTYIAVVPVESVMQRVETIRRVVVAVVIATVMVGIALAAVMAYRHTKPVQLLVHDNRALQSELKAQAPLLRAAFLERLLRGEFYSEHETRNIIEHVDVDLRGQAYTVILVGVGDGADRRPENELPGLQERRLMVQDVFGREVGSTRVILHNMYDRRITAIVVHDDDVPEIAHGQVERLVARWQRVAHGHGLAEVSFGVGGLCTALTDIAGSFEEARSALGHLQYLHSSSVAWFSDLSRSKQGYHFPQELETRLMNAVRAGDAEAVEALLEQLREENLGGRSLSEEYVRLLAFDLWATVLKLLEEQVIRDEELAKDTRSQFTDVALAEPHIALDACARSFYRLCESVDARKKSHNNTVVNRVKDFIQRHYADPALSLTLLSQEFSVSEAYLSGLFKEQTGENLSTYLQSVRMRHARDLLEETYIPVKDVGRRVGYPSYSTFARAFKRVFGVSASDFRTG